jgi:hypothetical protein
VNSIAGNVLDERLFDLPASDAYNELIKRAFPDMDSEEEDSDYKHLVSVGSLLDADFNVFLVESADQAKLIWGRRDAIPPVREVALKRGEFQSVVRDALRSNAAS